MNIDSPLTGTQLQLFYLKAVNEKVHYRVMFKMYEDMYDDKRKFIGFSKKTEIKTTSSPFSNLAGAAEFVKYLKEHLRGFAGWYKIIEYK